MLNRLPRKQVLMYLAIAVLLALAWSCMSKGSSPLPFEIRRSMYNKQRKSNYASPNMTQETSAGVMGLDIDNVDGMYANAEISQSNNDMKSSCTASNGVGLASSLLPRDAASQDNFGEFAPDDILKGMSFLEPRNQIGLPETIGGALRNANHQLRNEPPNPKKPYVWQNSTIAPDNMRRPLA